MATKTATDERRTHPNKEGASWRAVPQPGMTETHPERPIDVGTTDAPRYGDEDRGLLAKARDRLFGRH